jgi:hypothetical protein
MEQKILSSPAIFFNPSNISKLMKKSFFLLFSAAILFSFNAKAQSLSSPTGAGAVENFSISPMLGGEYNVTLVVTDSKSNPVAGAKVTLPCSGQPFEFTDAKGTVVFAGAGSCPCTNSPANISTTKSNVYQNVYCGTNYVTLPQ